METLTPVQRIAVTTIGLVLTAMIAIWVLPWASAKIVSWLPPTQTPMPATPSPVFTVTPTQTTGPTSTPTIALTPPPLAVSLELASYESQTPDPCNLAPLGIVLNYWGYTDTHEIIAPLACPGELDTNVGLEELGEYAESREMDAHIAVNGNVETLQQLLANGFPVIVTRWMTTTEGVEARRYQVVRGYDQITKTFTVHTLLVGPSITLPYVDMDRGWQAFNRQYILIYPPERREHVRAILGDDWGEKGMWENALDRAEGELKADAQDADVQEAFSWLNKASAFVALTEYEKAQEAFDKAREIGLPTRLLWHRFASYKCLLALENYERLLSLAQTAIDEGATVEEIHLYRAQAYVALNNAAQARAEYERALEIHPEWKPAKDGINALPE